MEFCKYCGETMGTSFIRSWKSLEFKEDFSICLAVRVAVFSYFGRLCVSVERPCLVSDETFSRGP